MSSLLQAAKTLVFSLCLGQVTLSDVMAAKGVWCLGGQMLDINRNACIECPENTYNDLNRRHTLTQCKRCPEPDENQEVLINCTYLNPGQLVCKKNYFWDKTAEKCSLCSECAKESIVSNCSKEKDTDCCNIPGYMVVSIDGKNQCQDQSGNGASKETSNGNRASRKMSNGNGASTTNMSCSLFIICAVLVMLHVCLTSDDGLFVR